MRYSIPDFENTEEFLALLAQKRGMLKKGGVPDIENITKVLLCDWTGYVCYELCFMLLTVSTLLIQHSRGYVLLCLREMDCLTDIENTIHG